MPAPGDWVTRRLGPRTSDLGARQGRRAARARQSLLASRQCAVLAGSGATHGRSSAPITAGPSGSTAPCGPCPIPAASAGPRGRLPLDRPARSRPIAASSSPISRGTPARCRRTWDGRRRHDRPAVRPVPDRRDQLGAGWIGHRVASNWKMWPESDNDGYHLDLGACLDAEGRARQLLPGHRRSAARRATPRARSTTATGTSSSTCGRATADLAWLGTTREKARATATALEAARGPSGAGAAVGRAAARLDLSEPVPGRNEPRHRRAGRAGATVHRHTAVQFAGVDEAFNRRLLRQSEAAHGPAGFIVPTTP